MILLKDFFDTCSARTLVTVYDGNTGEDLWIEPLRVEQFYEELHDWNIQAKREDRYTAIKKMHWSNLSKTLELSIV